MSIAHNGRPYENKLFKYKLNKSIIWKKNPIRKDKRPSKNVS